ncbi:MAG: CoA-binding protein, partial [Burkholderiales bacterium]|nr:CoA-binding protein [Burkholderiales bacterium]
MKPHYLSPLFDPRSVAVIGASETPGAVGSTVFANLLDGGYTGKLFPVNLHHDQVQGIAAFKSLAKVPMVVDLVIIATPAKTLIDLIEECGKKGVKAVVIMSCDFVGTDKKSQAQLDKIMERARHYGIRIMGPTVFGLCRVSAKFMAGNYQGKLKNGSMALVSQSSSITSAILDWAESHDVGFSSVVSLGSAADVDVGEVLDYLVADPKTQSILLYIEDLQEARTFMSAVRAAARSKPVMALKVGRYNDASAAHGRTHSERLIGRDDVFDAALKRAGVLRLRSINQLFTAAKVLNGTF